ncbi:MAG: hypothetical protein KDD35_10425, partial [Bdellovibrionales bacterium]|nr:hypothetical protein [Bdellovibrionales bacterium]
FFFFFYFKKPYLIFPEMNTKMLHHPITQASLHKLRNMGLTIFPTEVGTLACGERGEGKLMNTQNILQNISQYLSPSDSTHRRVNILVTAGGTSEPIDKVRVITNRSSGRTGSQIAIRLAQAGHRVTLFRAFNCGYIDDQIRNSPKNLRIVEFDSFESLKALLITQLKEAPYDLIIHSAAVSDFSVDEVSTFSGMNLNPPDKLPSSSDLILKLKRNPKLINRFREWSLPNRPLVIGFKLSCSSDSILRFEDVKRLQEEAKPDFIVSNELSEISEYKHPFTIFRNLDVWSKGETKQELFQSIEAIVNESILKELK